MPEPPSADHCRSPQGIIRLRGWDHLQQIHASCTCVEAQRVRSMCILPDGISRDRPPEAISQTSRRNAVSDLGLAGVTGARNEEGRPTL